MRNARTTRITAVLAATVLLAGCGRADRAGGTPATAPATTAPATTAPATTAPATTTPATTAAITAPASTADVSATLADAARLLAQSGALLTSVDTDLAAADAAEPEGDLP